MPSTERILACGLALTGQIDAARLHRERAERVYTNLRHAPGLLELSRCWDAATQEAADRQPGPQPPAETPSGEDACRAARNILEAAAALVLHAGRPELLAHEIDQSPRQNRGGSPRNGRLPRQRRPMRGARRHRQAAGAGNRPRRAGTPDGHRVGPRLRDRDHHPAERHHRIGRRAQCRQAPAGHHSRHRARSRRA